MDSNNEQSSLNVFWNKLQQLKFEITYLSLHFKRCVNISRTIKYVNVGLTTLSSSLLMCFSSIKPFVFSFSSFIIALQVFSAISKIFPYEKRQNELRELNNELEDVYNRMEYDWRILFNENKTSSEINDYINKYTSEISHLERHYLKDDVLPEIKRIIQLAEQKTSDYFRNFI